MQDTLHRFMTLFKGYEHAYGQHFLKGADEDGKVQGRGQTVAKAVTGFEFENHLAGKEASLGIIPLLENNNVNFGVIDIDIKGNVKLSEDHKSLFDKIEKYQLPLVLCKSKSGGAHLYCFGKEEISSKVMQSRLAEFAALLGYGGCEIFPKQTTRANEDDRGNWINICYYGTTRPCVVGNKELTLEEFLDYAEGMRVSEKGLSAYKLPESDMFDDGPPCLQHMAAIGFNQGSRNNSLLNVAIYFKLKDPDDWQDAVHKFNFENVSPPLKQDEVTQIIKSVARKNYNYTCKQAPICNYCNRKKCLKREYGIGSSDADEVVVPIESLTKCVAADSVRWYMEIGGHRIEVTTEQLLEQSPLQRILLEKLNIVLRPIKKDRWLKRIEQLIQTVEVIEEPEDASKVGQFDKLFDSFFTHSRPARNVDEIIKGNWWQDSDKNVYFRSEDLFNYLSGKKFAHNYHDIWTWIKDRHKGSSTRLNVMGKRVRVWAVPERQLFNNTDLPVPDIKEQENI